MTTYCHSLEDEIQPFRAPVPDQDIADLRARLGRTRWPETLPDAGWDYGVPLAYLHDLVDYWRTDFSWAN